MVVRADASALVWLTPSPGALASVHPKRSQVNGICVGAEAGEPEELLQKPELSRTTIWLSDAFPLTREEPGQLLQHSLGKDRGHREDADPQLCGFPGPLAATLPDPRMRTSCHKPTSS